MYIDYVVYSHIYIYIYIGSDNGTHETRCRSRTDLFLRLLDRGAQHPRLWRRLKLHSTEEAQSHKLGIEKKYRLHSENIIATILGQGALSFEKNVLWPQGAVDVHNLPTTTANIKRPSRFFLPHQQGNASRVHKVRDRDYIAGLYALVVCAEGRGGNMAHDACCDEVSIFLHFFCLIDATRLNPKPSES